MKIVQETHRKVEKQYKKQREQTKETNKNIYLSSNTSITLTLYVTGLNAPIKKQRLTEWIKKHDCTIYCLQ